MEGSEDKYLFINGKSEFSDSWIVWDSLKGGKGHIASASSGQACPAHPGNGYDFNDSKDDFCDVDTTEDESWVSCREAITVMTNGGAPSNIEGRELRIIGPAK